MKNAYINYSSSFLPNEPVENHEIENILGSLGKKYIRLKEIVLKNNGIKTRYYAIDRKTLSKTHNNYELTSFAIKEVIKKSGISYSDIHGLACGTSTPDFFFPSHASMVQGELKLPQMDILSSSGVCCSGISALKYAFLNIKSGSFDNFLVSGSELVSPHLISNRFKFKDKEINVNSDPKIAFNRNFLRYMLSDGAGALFLQSKPLINQKSLRIDWIDIKSYAGELPVCMHFGASKDLKSWSEFSLDKSYSLGAFNIAQDVKLLDRNIIKYGIKKALKLLIKEKNLLPTKINWFLPHFSSMYFKDSLFQALNEINFNIPYNKWYTNLEKKGNTGAASIFIMLDEFINSKKLKKGDKIFCLIPESSRFTFAHMHLTVV